MKNKIKSIALISGIALILVIAFTTVIGVLMFTNVIKWDSSPYLVMFSTLSLGLGAYTLGLAFFSKSGSTLSVGAIVFDAGLICLLIALDVLVGIIIAVGIAILLVAFVIICMMYAKPISDGLKTTDKEEDYIPYMEKLAKEKELEKQNEQELPKIKSFKD